MWEIMKQIPGAHYVYGHLCGTRTPGVRMREGRIDRVRIPAFVMYVSECAYQCPAPFSIQTWPTCGYLPSGVRSFPTLILKLRLATGNETSKGVIESWLSCGYLLKKCWLIFLFLIKKLHAWIILSGTSHNMM